MNEMNNICGRTAGYYDSLSAAAADINNGVIRIAQTDSAKVKVSVGHTGRLTVLLLDDVSESTAIDINKDVDLVLDGKGLSFTGNGCLNFGAGTDCVICGEAEGSSIEKTIAAEAAGRHLIKTDGTRLKLKGGTYRISGYYPDGFMTVRATNTCGLLEVTDCQVSALHAGEQTDTGVRTIQTEAAETLVKNATITAQARPYAHGVFGLGSITIDGSDLSATSDSGNARAVYSVSGAVMINASTVSASSVNAPSNAVYSTGRTVSIDGTALNASSETYYTGALYVDCERVTVVDCVIHSVTHGETDVAAYGIQVHPGCTLKARDTNILADAKGASAVEGPMSIAITNNGTAFLENVTLNGTHSGMVNSGGGKLYVSGGTYTGYCHGGIYFAHGPEGEAFVNDATLRGGNYEGIFDFSHQNVNYSALYIGGGSSENSSNMTAYLDGCIIDGTDADSSMVVRGSSGEQNNTLNVSNCTLVDPAKWIRVDNDTLRINIGMGGNITAASLKYLDADLETPIDYIELGRAVFNNELYRRHHAGHICDGRDYAALTALVEAKLSA